MNLPFSRVGIVGVGLIGGSIGLALKKASCPVEIIGIGRNEERLRRAREIGIVDRVAGGFEGLQDCDLVILATPIGQIVEMLEIIADWIPPGTVLTDVGSTKRTICETAWRSLPASVEFIGGHPVAGREVAGMENSLAGLFEGAPYVFCPRPGSAPQNLRRLESFAEILGARTFVMTPEEHDRLVARVSHLPQLLSTALANFACTHEPDIFGSGLRDMVRLAGSPYSIWEGIFRTNRDNIVLAFDEFIRHLEQMRRMLEDGRLGEEFERAGQNQRKLRVSSTTGIPGRQGQ